MIVKVNKFMLCHIDANFMSLEILFATGFKNDKTVSVKETSSLPGMALIFEKFGH